MRYYFALAIIIVTVGCSQTASNNNTNSSNQISSLDSRNESPLGRPHLPDESQNAQPSPNPLDVEAQNEATKYWNKYLVKCGNSYFYQPNGYYVAELRDSPRFELLGQALQQKKLTRAEELNGVDPLPVE